MVVNRITSGKCRLPQHFFVPMFLMVNTIWLSWVFFRNIMIELSWIEVILTRRIVRFESSFPHCWFFLQPKFDYSLFIVWQRLQGPFYVIIFLIIKISSFFLNHGHHFALVAYYFIFLFWIGNIDWKRSNFKTIRSCFLRDVSAINEFIETPKTKCYFVAFIHFTAHYL